MVPGALVFFADPHAAISDGIISGTGVECDATVRARIGLDRRRPLDRPILEVDDTVQVLGFGPTVEAATEDAARGAVDYVAARTGMDRREAYMLLSIVGELRIGTSPRPVMAARLIIPGTILAAAGRAGA
jgi:acetamidase/formamidase